MCVRACAQQAAFFTCEVAFEPLNSFTALMSSTTWMGALSVLMTIRQQVLLVPTLTVPKSRVCTGAGSTRARTHTQSKTLRRRHSVRFWWHAFCTMMPDQAMLQHQSFHLQQEIAPFLGRSG